MKTPILSFFFAAQTAILSLPDRRCKIAVFPLWIDSNPRKQNDPYAQAGRNQKSPAGHRYPHRRRKSYLQRMLDGVAETERRRESVRFTEIYNLAVYYLRELVLHYLSQTAVGRMLLRRPRITRRKRL